jgi:undecaprenyl-diphosphatase
MEHGAAMLIELLADFARLALIVAGAAAVLQASARRGLPGWAAHLTQRRLAVLGLVTLAMTGAEVFEDVLAGESGPIDTALLWFIRNHVPLGLTGFFAAVTRSGSVAFLLPATVIFVVALLVARRRFEALLMGTSMATATLLVYGIKTLVGRVRPALWETQWYSGSSFPSGHTLATAAFAVAGGLCAARFWPRRARAVMAAALTWTALVALSRLVLGVHWPSDVLAALCVGAFVPLMFSVAFDRPAIRASR